MNNKAMYKFIALFILIACISIVFILKSENKQVVGSNAKEIEKAGGLAVESIKINRYIKVAGVSEDMYTPDYWINKISNADQVVMSRDEIDEFNRNIIKSVDQVYDIKQYKESLEKEELIKLINEYKIPDKKMYNQQGEIIQQDTYRAIIDNQNISAIKDDNSVRYGIVVNRTSLRSFPSDIGIYDSKNSKLDRFQETGCQIGEPLLVLHESADKEWLFVQIYNYSGWVRSKDVAIADSKERLFDYTDTSNFVVVTENRIEIKSKETGRLEFNMGAKIPVLDDSGTTIKLILPTRDEEGSIKFTTVEVQKSNFFSKGYLLYTKANVIRQAFKILGTSYDWGDKNGGYDCSSFIMSVYKTFGFSLPRNAGQQAMIPGKNYIFDKSYDIEKREDMFKNIDPGSAIFMPGHAMMYLGENNGIPFIIHSFVGYSKETPGGYEFIPVNSTTVTPAIIYTSSGSEYIDKFTSVVSIKQ